MKKSIIPALIFSVVSLGFVNGATANPNQPPKDQPQVQKQSNKPDPNKDKNQNSLRMTHATPQQQKTARQAQSIQKQPPKKQPMPQKAAPPPVNKTSDIQKMLTDLRYHPGPVDGQMGNRTRSAIKQFQRDNHLPATGKADPQTMSLLQKKSGHH